MRQGEIKRDVRMQAGGQDDEQQAHVAVAGEEADGESQRNTGSVPNAMTKLSMASSLSLAVAAVIVIQIHIPGNRGAVTIASTMGGMILIRGLGTGVRRHEN
ncbi:MAG: hypothetical protein IIB67_11880 [Proteobacteria bacterium]|nr:hypothetical protein [Pseudomonadota bacterium]